MATFADRMLYCHRTVLKVWFNCSTLTKFHNFSYVGVRCFTSPSQVDLVHDKGTSLPLSTLVVADREDIYFFKLGEERWHLLNEPGKNFFHEIMYFSKDQRFYAMANLQHIEAWDLSDPSCPKREMINPELIYESVTDCLIYLVESSGDLLLVLRFCHADGDATPLGFKEDDHNAHKFTDRRVHLVEDFIGPFHQSLRFEVYKLNFNQNKWESVECLGDRALFVGRNHSFSLSTRDYPELRENSIYFTDNYEEVDIGNYTGHDNGISHLKDNSITPYYPLTLNCSKLPPVAVRHPVWVAPNKL